MYNEDNQKKTREPSPCGSCGDVSCASAKQAIPQPAVVEDKDWKLKDRLSR